MVKKPKTKCTVIKVISEKKIIKAYIQPLFFQSGSVIMVRNPQSPFKDACLKH